MQEQKNTQELNNIQEVNSRTEKRKNGTINILLVEVVSLFAGFIFLLIMNWDSGWNFHSIYRYVDLVVLVLLLVLTLPTLITSGMWRDFVRALSLRRPEEGWKLYELKRTLDAIELLQKQFIYAAVLVVMFQLIGMLYNMSELSTIGPALAYVLMTGLYTAVIELLLIPLKVGVQREITDYMEEER